MTAKYDTAPPERWQHGDAAEIVDTGRQQVARPVLALWKSGKVGDAEVTAAERFYGDYAVAVGGASLQAGGNLVRTDSGGIKPHDGISGAAVIAMSNYRAATEALGIAATALLLDFVIEGRSLTNIGARAGTNAHHMGGRVVAALRRLSEHYAGPPGAGARRRAAVSRRDTENG